MRLKISSLINSVYCPLKGSVKASYDARSWQTIYAYKSSDYTCKTFSIGVVSVSINWLHILNFNKALTPLILKSLQYSLHFLVFHTALCIPSAKNPNNMLENICWECTTFSDQRNTIVFKDRKIMYKDWTVFMCLKIISRTTANCQYCRVGMEIIEFSNGIRKSQMFM